jgi:hypothetical protein
MPWRYSDRFPMGRSISLRAASKPMGIDRVPVPTPTTACVGAKEKVEQADTVSTLDDMLGKLLATRIRWSDRRWAATYCSRKLAHAALEVPNRCRASGRPANRRDPIWSDR